MEEESSIAKVRNKLSPIVTYFSMKQLLDTTTSLTSSDKSFLENKIQEEYKNIQKVYLLDLLTLIKDDSIW